MPTGAHRKWTYDDLLRLPDDGKRHEIIDGEHFVMPSPSRRHQELIGRLHLALGNFLTERPTLGQAYLAPLDVLFSQSDVVEPDLLFVAHDQIDILTEKNVQGAPALVIEVLSESTRKRDEQIKRRLFARGGVREYWLVDPEFGWVTVYRRIASRMFCRVARLAAADRAVLTTPLLPEFALEISELFK